MFVYEYIMHFTEVELACKNWQSLTQPGYGFWHLKYSLPFNEMVHRSKQIGCVI